MEMTTVGRDVVITQSSSAGWRESNKLVLLIVANALFLDNMLQYAVVPIIPELLYDIRHRAADRADPVVAQWTTTTSAPPIRLETQVIFVNESGRYASVVPGNLHHLSITKHEELLSENVEVGALFASKALVQLCANLFIGPLTNRIGFRIPMFAGVVVMFLSSLMFAFGRSYFALFFARAIQGVGSSCSSVAGMGWLAERYPNDRERGNAMAKALGGLALGILLCPPFGGIMYQFVGKTKPFLILAGLALENGLLQLLVVQPRVVRRQETNAPRPSSSSLKTLLFDPYIIVTAGAILFTNMGIAILEPSLPIWMMDTMDAPRWQLGAAFLPLSISYVIGINLFGPIGHRIGRWLAAMIGLIVVGICLICITQATNLNYLIGPTLVLGVAMGMVDSSMMPELGYLVDIRHTSVYGSVYAIGDVAFCLGFAIGPAMSGMLVKAIGFEWMLVGVALIIIAYAPLLFLLRNPPTKNEIISSST